MTFIDNKYWRQYQRIIVCYQGVRLRRYTERHHIVQRSLGGADDRSNIVRLPARAHFVAHLLLTRCTTGETRKRMFYALWRMCISPRQGMRVTSRRYAAVRSEIAIQLSQDGKAQGWARFFGGPRTDAWRNGWSNDNPNSETLRSEQSARHKRLWADPEYRERMRQSRSSSGTVRANIERLAASKRGRPHTDLHRQRIAEANRNSEALRRQADERRGVPRSADDRAKISAGHLRFHARRRAMLASD